VHSQGELAGCWPTTAWQVTQTPCRATSTSWVRQDPRRRRATWSTPCRPRAATRRRGSHRRRRERRAARPARC
jgi:hypothetical protein